MLARGSHWDCAQNHPIPTFGMANGTATQGCLEGIGLLLRVDANLCFHPPGREKKHTQIEADNAQHEVEIEGCFPSWLKMLELGVIVP